MLKRYCVLGNVVDFFVQRWCFVISVGNCCVVANVVFFDHRGHHRAGYESHVLFQKVQLKVQLPVNIFCWQEVTYSHLSSATSRCPWPSSQLTRWTRSASHCGSTCISQMCSNCDVKHCEVRKSSPSTHGYFVQSLFLCRWPAWLREIFTYKLLTWTARVGRLPIVGEALDDRADLWPHARYRS